MRILSIFRLAFDTDAVASVLLGPMPRKPRPVVALVGGRTAWADDARLFESSGAKDGFLSGGASSLRSALSSLASSDASETDDEHATAIF